MSNKLAFIVDDSQQYLSNQVKEIMESWEFQNSEYKTVFEWKPGIANVSLLFGKTKAIHLDLSDTNNLNKFVDFIKDDEKNKKTLDNSNWYGVGLIITTTKAKGIKKIEQLITKNKGLFIKKRKPEELKEEILASLKINNKLKQFLSDYAGNDYDLLLNCSNSLKKIPEDELKNKTIEDLFIFLPVKKGAVPPWEFVSPMIQCNTPLALDKLRRILENSHSLLVMTFLKRKIEELYHEKVLLVSGMTKINDRASFLNANPWALKYNSNIISKISLDVLENIVLLVNDSEDKLKGGADVGNVNLFMETLITKIIIALKYNMKVG